MIPRKKALKKKMTKERAAKKKTSKKTALIISILCAFAIMVLIGVFCTGGYVTGNSPEKIASVFTEAAYTGNYEQIFELLPEKLQERSLESTKDFNELETNEEALSYQGKALTDYMAKLDAIFGEDWTFEYEIKDVEYYTVEEREELNLMFKMMNVEDYKVNKAARVFVEVSFQAVNGTTGSVDFYVPVIRSGFTWGLGQYVGTGAPDTDFVYQTRFGDLMDGFIIEGLFDADGNRVDYDGEGYMATQQKDGTWIGYDEYGNIRYYDKDFNLLDVTGPDGGEVLTESTYEKYYGSVDGVE